LSHVYVIFTGRLNSFVVGTVCVGFVYRKEQNGLKLVLSRINAIRPIGAKPSNYSLDIVFLFKLL